jgi:D-alanyl-D-alanine carboxypeptidase
MSGRWGGSASAPFGRQAIMPPRTNGRTVPHKRTGLDGEYRVQNAIMSMISTIRVMLVIALFAGVWVSGLGVREAAALEPQAPPDVTAESAFVFDATLDTVLYEKNADERRSPASTTKIGTALAVLDLATDLDLPVVVDAADVLDPSQGESMVGLVAGDVLTIEQLLYGLLINSGNDAAYTLARHFGTQFLEQEGATGDPRARFVQEMNAYFQRIGLTNTHFENPEGLYHPDHLTTAREMARMTQLALQNPLIATIVATEETTITSLAAVPVSYTLQTTNRLLGQDGFHGVKTGTLSESGACLVASRDSPAGTLIISVVLGSDIEFTPEGFQDPETDERFDDTRALFDALERDYAWIAPLNHSALSGLAEEMDAWDVALQSTDPFIVPAAQADALRYLLRLGPPVEPNAEAGALLLFDGNELIAERPVLQRDAA